VILGSSRYSLGNGKGHRLGLGDTPLPLSFFYDSTL